MPRSALDDVLECMICMDDIINNAYLCPECWKMACRKCWDGVILSAGSCPYCRSKLNQSNLIKCRWIDDVRLCVKQLLDESDQTECDKARVNEMEESLISIRSQLDQERKVFKDEKNEFLQEKEVFIVELELSALTEKTRLAVEKAIYNEKQDKYNNGIQKFVDLQKRAEIAGGGWKGGPETDDQLQLRGQADLEFIQCLADPNYLNFLAQRGYLKEEAFVKYLKYLCYWKEAEYAKYVKYPACLYFLDLLQHEHFRREVANAQCKRSIDYQQVLMWQHYEKKEVLDNTQKLSFSGQDNVDELVAWFNEMISKLSALTKELVDGKERLLANRGGPNAA